MEISPKEIYKKIKDTPSLQQESLFKSYENVKISGFGSLISVDRKHPLVDYAFGEDKKENEVYLHLSTWWESNEDYIFYPIIWCKVDMDKYSYLKIIKNGSKVKFVGEIKKLQPEDIYVICSDIKLIEEKINTDNNLSSKKPTDEGVQKEIDVKEVETKSRSDFSMSGNTLVGTINIIQNKGDLKDVEFNSNTKITKEKKTTPKPWWKRWKVILEIIATIVGIIVGIISIL